jgi:BMFP domain-containing protein YqiC
MPLKPPPIGDLLQQLSALAGEDGLKGELDRNGKALLQSALQRLEVVSREEFDIQAALLARTRERVQALEHELEQLQAQLAAAEQQR